MLARNYFKVSSVECENLSLQITRFRVTRLGRPGWVTFGAHIRFRHEGTPERRYETYAAGHGEDFAAAGEQFDQCLLEMMVQAFERWGFDCTSGHCG